MFTMDRLAFWRTVCFEAILCECDGLAVSSWLIDGESVIFVSP